MANFWDLPKDVREGIYRMHLVQRKKVNYARFKALCGCTQNEASVKVTKLDRIMPLIFQVSRKLETEASHIFFGENTFLIAGHTYLAKWVMRLWPRHAKQIRSVYLTEWASSSLTKFEEEYDTDDFRRLASAFRLRSFSIVVDEKRALEFLIRDFNSTFVWHASLTAGPQMQLHMLRAEGMAGLRTLRGLEHVQFIHPKVGLEPGAIPGGFLETVVRREIMQPSDAPALDEGRQGHFKFMDLPPELRNNVYTMLLVQSGAMYPRTGEPTSITSVHRSKRASVPFPHSALSILCANRQINREAYSLFYKHNDFVFADPMRLQHFIISLGHERLDCIASITFFYKKSALAAGGLTTMDVTLSTLRLLKNLRKLHILIPIPTEVDQPRKYLSVDKIMQQPEANPATLPGAKTLFSFRGLTDIKVFPPIIAKEYANISPQSAADSVAWMEHAFERFSYGLRLAQTGRVCHELYENRNWMKERRWPALDTQTWACGREDGCVCPQNSDDQLA